MEEPKIFEEIRSWYFDRVNLYGLTYKLPEFIIVSQEVYDAVDYYYDEFYTAKYGYRPVFPNSGVFIRNIELTVGEIKG